MLAIPYITDGTTANNVSLWAPLIQLNKRSGDESLLQQASPSSASSTTSTSASPATSSNASHSSTNTVAIAVAVPIVVLAAVIAGVVFWLSCRRRRRSRQEQLSAGMNDDQPQLAEIDGRRTGYELEDTNRSLVHEKQSRAIPAELPATGYEYEPVSTEQF